MHIYMLSGRFTLFLPKKAYAFTSQKIIPNSIICPCQIRPANCQQIKTPYPPRQIPKKLAFLHHYLSIHGIFVLSPASYRQVRLRPERHILHIARSSCGIKRFDPILINCLFDQS